MYIIFNLNLMYHLVYCFFTTFWRFTYIYSCFICISFSMVQCFEHFTEIALFKLNIIIIFLGAGKRGTKQPRPSHLPHEDGEVTARQQYALPREIRE